MNEMENFLENDIIMGDMENIYFRDIEWNKLKSKTILITGAYGMIASYFTFMCIYLNEIQDYDITIIAAVKNIDKLRKRFGTYVDKSYFEVQITDLNKQINYENKIDFIIHAASLASTEYYYSRPIDVIMPNVLGTINLLELAKEKRSESFLFFSSGEIYGKLNENVKIVDEDTVGEADTLDLRYCYCQSKRMGEMLCYSWYKQEEVPIKIARIYHTFGPTIDIENDKRVFSAFVKDVVNNNDIIMKSGGTNRRIFCYIADVVAGFFKILLDGENGEAYNVCNEKGTLMIKQLAEMLVDLYPEKNIKVKINIDENRYNVVDKMENSADISNNKLKNLGWDCKYSIEDGFRRTIDYLKDNIV